MSRLVCTAALLLTLTHTARPASPADTAPADALALFSFKGSHHLGPAYDSSHLKAVLDASSFPKFYHDLMPQLLEKSLANDLANAQSLASALSTLEILGRQGFAFTVLPGSDNMPVALELTSNANDEADALEKLLNPLPPSAKITVTRHGTTLTLHFGPPVPDADAHLASAAPFQSALKQVDADPVILVYLDTERMLSWIEKRNDIVPNNPWPAIKPLTGLAGLHHFIATGAFDGPNWSSQSFLDAPAPRTGWLALAESTPTPPALLARVPADATSVKSAHFDVQAWVNNFRQIAAAAHPEGQMRFDQALGLVQLYVGRNLVTDVLAPLGTDWVSFSSPSLAGKNPHANTLLVSKVVDEAKARDGLTSLFFAAANTSQNPRIKQSGFSATVDNAEIGELKILSLKFDKPIPNFGPLSVSWTIKAGHLYLGLSPESVAAAANFAGQSFPESQHLATARKHLAAPESASIQYSDAAAIVPDAYTQIRSAADMGLGLLAGKGLNPPANPLPTLASLQPHLTPIYTASWTSADGFHSKSSSPFPGAGILTGDSDTTTTVGASALGVSILLPSLNRARETSNRIKCASNMKQIGQGILLYSNENKGKYPPDLATLAATEDISPGVFLCPDSNTKEIHLDPNPNAEANLKALRDLINTHNDYIYVGQSLTNAANPDTLVLYENMNHHTDGTNMLFADGHVDFVPKAQAERLIAAGKDIAK